MLKKIALAAVLASASATSAAASTVYYDATSAQSLSRAHDFHSLWSSVSLGTLGQRFHFAPEGSLELTETDDGLMGMLSGRVESANDASSGWELEYSYDQDLSAYGDDGPRFKNEQGSAARQALVGDNIFLHMTGGTLRGFGDLVGADFDVSIMPVPGDNEYAVQVGTGSNNKNNAYGLANWFYFNQAQSCSSDYCGVLGGRQGDINIDLAAVPVPAAGLLLLAGLGSLAGMRRIKR